jgi:hypothetical protein
MARLHGIYYKLKVFNCSLQPLAVIRTESEIETSGQLEFAIGSVSC